MPSRPRTLRPGRPRRAAAIALGVLSSLAVLAPTARTQDAGWTWIRGVLEDADDEARYAQLARDMHAFYTERGMLTGPLVLEAELDARPAGGVVHIGPLAAFERTAWLVPPFEQVEDDAFTIGGRRFEAPRTGAFVQSEDGTHVVFTGLSLDGFADVFTIPTGREAFTATIDGARRFGGRYTEAGLELEVVPFLPVLPTADELASYAPHDGALDARVCTDALLVERVRALTAEARVLFVGETHWNVGVEAAFATAFEALLADGRVDALFLELPFACSAAFDHYVRIADDDAAALFFAFEVDPFVKHPSLERLLAAVRRHNVAHEDARVRVHCYDLEWFGHAPLNSLWRRMEVTHGSVTEALAGGEARERFIDRVREVLSASPEASAELSHLTPQFVDRVLTSCATTFGLPDDPTARTARRQEAIVRAITEFGAEHFDGDGLAVFKGGSYHAHTTPPADGQPWRDAAHLQHVFEPTRGRVRTLLVRGLGVRFDAISAIDDRVGDLPRMTSADTYNDLVARFRRGRAGGYARARVAYLLEGRPPTAIESLLVRASARAESDRLWIDGVDAEGLRRAGGDVGEDPLQAFDAAVFVLRSELEFTRYWPMGARRSR